MKRSKLDANIQQTVSVRLFDGSTFRGMLYPTGHADLARNPNLFIPHNHYVLVDEQYKATSCIFRSSHVTHCTPIRVIR